MCGLWGGLLYWLRFLILSMWCRPLLTYGVSHFQFSIFNYSLLRVLYVICFVPFVVKYISFSIIYLPLYPRDAINRGLYSKKKSNSSSPPHNTDPIFHTAFQLSINPHISIQIQILNHRNQNHQQRNCQHNAPSAH